MCNDCGKYKSKEYHYNYCPICGDKLMEFSFIPTKTNVSYSDYKVDKTKTKSAKLELSEGGY